MDRNELVTLTADIVAAHLSHNSVAIRDIASLIHGVHASLDGLGTAPQEAAAPKAPKVSARASITPDHLVCMTCGDRLRVMRRHLRIVHGMTPEEYRRAYGLRWDYPMTAPNYSKVRRDLAKASGLGRKGNVAAKAARPRTGGAGKGAGQKRRTAGPKT
jgi:predicted transcriptional regulator